MQHPMCYHKLFALHMYRIESIEADVCYCNYLLYVAVSSLSCYFGATMHVLCMHRLHLADGNIRFELKIIVFHMCLFSISFFDSCSRVHSVCEWRFFLSLLHVSIAQNLIWSDFGSGVVVLNECAFWFCFCGVT